MLYYPNSGNEDKMREWMHDKIDCLYEDELYTIASIIYNSEQVVNAIKVIKSICEV